MSKEPEVDLAIEEVAPAVVRKAATTNSPVLPEDSHAEFIGRLVVRGLAKGTVRDAFFVRYPEARKADFERVWQALAEGLSAEFERDKPHAKALQATRLEAYLTELRKEKRWAVAARVEALLADILGTRAPTTVNVNARIAGAFVGLTASLSPEEANQMLARGRERRALAAAAEAAGLASGKVVEAPQDDP